MARPPSKKPTETFGHIAFSKDGAANKTEQRLPDVKAEQEVEIGKRFAEGLTQITGEAWRATSLSEADHDFLLSSGTKEVEVQAIEIAAKYDFLVALTEQQWIEKTHGFSSVVMLGEAEYWGIDPGRRREVVWQKISKKLEKNYAKPVRPLWLLVWTVHPAPLFFWSQGGTERASSSVSFARRQIAQSVLHPFDEVWVCSPHSPAAKIWPCDAAALDLPEEPDPDIKRGGMSLYVPAHLMTVVKVPGKQRR